MSNQTIREILERLTLTIGAQVTSEYQDKGGVYEGLSFNNVQSISHAEAAIKSLTAEKVHEAIETTWYYTGEGYNAEYHRHPEFCHFGGKRYTDHEVMQKVLSDVLAEIRKPNPIILDS